MSDTKISESLNILGLIPARMGSSRFPGKPMAPILGKPMIGHVYERVSKAPDLTLTAVATCDEEIAAYIRSIGGTAVLTRNDHDRASDRCAEALKNLEEEREELFDIVVMVQGDEPMTEPEMIGEVLKPMLEDENVQVANLLGKIESEEELFDRNCIKVVCNLVGDALYFSRQPIPLWREADGNEAGKQVCIIPFRRDYLLEYSSLTPTPLEMVESVDMLRILEHGGKVKMVPTAYKTYAVDTPLDLKRIEQMMSA